MSTAQEVMTTPKKGGMSQAQKDRARKNVGLSFGYIVLIVVAALVTLPTAWLFVSTFKVDSELMLWPIRVFPSTWHWDNYVKVFALTPFLKIAIRTGLLAFSCASIGALTAAMGGYGFARFFDVKGNHGLFQIVIVLLIIPGIVFMIPQFILYTLLHLTNTYWPWILGALTGGAYNIFLFRQFFLGFPRELEEAAEIDGCNSLRFFWQILVPNSTPVFATVMIFSFGGIWGDYLGPLLYLTDKNTLLGVTMATAFVDPHGNALRTVSYAATVYFVLPLIIFFFLGQKYILKGYITSGLKG